MLSLRKYYLLIALAFLALPAPAYAGAKAPRCIGRGRTEITILTQAKGLSTDYLQNLRPEVTISSRLSRKQMCFSKTVAVLNKKKSIRKIPREAQITVAAPLCSVFKASVKSSKKVRKITLHCSIPTTPTSTPTPIITKPTPSIPFEYSDFTQITKVSRANDITIYDIIPETYASSSSLQIYEPSIQQLAMEAFDRQSKDLQELKEASIATQRARVLQGAVDFSNLVAKSLPATKIRIVIPPADYDVLDLGPQPGRPGYTSLSTKDAPYMPRLAIASLAPRSSIELLSPWAAYPEIYASSPGEMTPKPKLSYYDSECNSKDTCRARVILLIAVNQEARIDGIAFEGDHDHRYRHTYEYYVHENPARKTIVGMGRVGMVMVGTLASSSEAKTLNNGAVFNDITLSRINFRGIQVFGNSTILNSDIKGMVQLPREGPWISHAASYALRTEWIEGVRAGITSLLHTSDNPGQAWNAGIYIDSQLSLAPTVIEHNTFSNLIQGVVSLALGERSSVSYGRFSYILDHALYSLAGIKKNSKISYNHITRTFGFALKFAGHSDAANTASLSGVNGSEIVGNYFFHIRDGLIALSGSDNYIAHNRYDPYEPSLDETMGWFDPINDSIPGNSLNPKIMISTFGGNYSCVTLPNSAIPKQPGFSNTSKGNVIENNSASSGSVGRHPRYLLDKMTVFIDQAQGSSNPLYNSYMGNKYADRSIDANTVLLSGTPNTYAYFRKRTYSLFSTGIATDSPSQLTEGIPPSCKGCEYTANSVSISVYSQNPCAI